MTFFMSWSYWQMMSHCQKVTMTTNCMVTTKDIVNATSPRIGYLSI